MSIQNSHPRRTAAVLLAIELSEAGLELRDVAAADRPAIPRRAQFVGTFEIDASWGRLDLELWSHTRRPFSDAEKQRILTETKEKVIKANAEEVECGPYPWDCADPLADHDALARNLYRNMRSSEPRMLLKRVVRLLFDEEELGVLLREVKSRNRQIEDEAWLFDSDAWERLARERPMAS